MLLQAIVLGLLVVVLLQLDAAPGQAQQGAVLRYGVWLVLALAFLTGGLALLGFRRWQQKLSALDAERERLQRLLRRSEDYHRVFCHAPDGLLILDPDELIVLDANEQACEIYGIPREMLVANSLHNTRLNTHVFEQAIRRLRTGRRSDRFELNNTRFKGAASLAVTASLVEFHGRQVVVCASRDISGSKALETELNHQAFHDPLTGLANRALFRNRVEHAFSRAMRTPSPFTVLFLDLDNFKKINDSLGHDTGDQLLIEVGRRLLVCVRINDTVARLGGDEFAILLDSTSAVDSVYVAERILRELPMTYMIEGREVVVGTSIGVAESSTSADVEDLLRNADAAMYVAKRSGKGRFKIFDLETRLAEVSDPSSPPSRPLSFG